MGGPRSKCGDPLVAEAESLARHLLDGDEHRTRHVATAAAQAAALSSTVDPADRATLVAAAWLHDIGYSEWVRDTGFHPVDGARYLRSRGWSTQLSDLVAHHSGARFVAGACGMSRELDEFTFLEDSVSDALTIADQTSGPCGQVMVLDDRLREMLTRHGPESANSRAHQRRAPYLVAALARVSTRLSLAGAAALVPCVSIATDLVRAVPGELIRMPAELMRAMPVVNLGSRAG